MATEILRVDAVTRPDPDPLTLPEVAGPDIPEPPEVLPLLIVVILVAIAVWRLV